MEQGVDTIAISRYSVSKTAPQTSEDLNRRYSADLRNPENITESIEYNVNEGNYSVGVKLGDSYLETPLLMTKEEYRKWSMQRSMESYFHNRYISEKEQDGEDKFDFTNMHFDLGPAEKIFGPGGVQVRSNGSASVKFGLNRSSVENPSLSIQNRKTGGFDFDEQINLSINAQVGDKINMNMNYNTEATFTFDTKKIKLRYEGKEDEIIRLLEAGNISFPTNSSLIQGSTSLFGIRADLQFGKLKLQTVLSQKNSTSTSVSSKGGEQLTEFEIAASDYDENRHFFLGHFFRDNYDKNMSMLPTIISGIYINRIEVWVTNKRSSYDAPRNIIAFTDLGEGEVISNNIWSGVGNIPTSNNANNLYRRIITDYPTTRDIDQTATTIGTFLTGSTDYEKIANARRLNESEYILNNALGYISLKSALSADEVLAVAYEYTYNGESFQVGEFSTDITDSNKAIFLKLIKPNSNVPGSGTWDLMMKNIYSLGSGAINSGKFKLNILYASDSIGSHITYLPESSLKSINLLQLMNLDRLDDNQALHPNGRFDYIEGYTVISSMGRIIFPVVEPFGTHLEKMISNPTIAKRYLFHELYDSTKVVARRVAERDKFLLVGQHSGSSNSVIELGVYNIPRGSVKVTAGGTTLVENSDYIVDYSMGSVTIINQNIIDAGTSVDVQLESNTDYSLQRKSMAGINWLYDFNKDFQIGGTVMHLNERPLTSKVTMGDEPLVNTMLGLNINYKHESQALTNLIDLIPFVNATRPSYIAVSAEMAQLKSSVSDKVQGNSSYIDDFESAENGIDLSRPSAWSLSSVPTGIPGYNLSNNVMSGYHRALLNWFTIDPIFTRRNSLLTPAHIKSDLDQLSNHYVREVYERELYPNKESTSSESTTLSVLNLAYYPSERGPYNLNPDLNSDGTLTSPSQSWAGITRSISTTNFETANIEYIEFWMLDPFIYNPNAVGGDMFINLGEVSEDILLDGKKSFENGLPVDDDPSLYTTTVWGKVPTSTSFTYAFDNSNAENRKKQDVGYNGLSSAEERLFPTYADYLDKIKSILTPSVYEKFYNDPAADNFHHYRGADYDKAQLSILDRYKLYNGVEGNSPNSNDTSEKFDQSSRTTPDAEDINHDYTLDEYERFFQYRISLRPSDLQVGGNYISDKRDVKVKLRNGKMESVTWYCFRIPIHEYERAIGGIRDFSSIRFMRIFLTNFQENTHIRFGTLELMSSQWRNYEQPIASATNKTPTISGRLTTSSVNIEENGDRQPVNYVVPPGVTRILDPMQTQLIQDNEQAMSIKVIDMASGEARAIYKKSSLDLRRYSRIQMFTHIEQLIASSETLDNGDISMFIRIGTDYTNNFYEYEIPLRVTESGKYSNDSESDRRKVWPEENMLDIDLNTLTEAKSSRNRVLHNGEASKGGLYTIYDPNRPENRITIMGNPSIGNVKAIMIGMRNNSLSTKSAEMWINELRLVGYESHGGMAARSNISMKLADIGSLDAVGEMRTAGYGGLEQNIGERSLDNRYKYSVTSSINMGRFLPEKAKVSLPLYYSYTREKVAPHYSPFDNDLMLEDIIDSYDSKYEKDSIRSISQDITTNKNFSISNAKIEISSEKPMPYDPSNFTLSYSSNTEENSGRTIVYDREKSWRANVAYSYSPSYNGWRPFSFIRYQSNWLTILKDITINPLPQNFTFNSTIGRNYHELQERDLEMQADNAIPALFSQQFYWNRDMTLRWDMLRDLRLSITSKTQAEIEEPYMIVNKHLYPTEYELWKDSVKHSLYRMGNPLDYQQQTQLSYQIPLNKLPLFSWVTSDISISTHYGWNRGAKYSKGNGFGNIISNGRNIAFNGRMNMQSLYSMIPYLKQIDSKYSSKRTNSTTTPPKKVNAYNKELTFVPDSTFVIKHNQNTLKPRVTITKKDGSTIKIRYKSIDANSIQIRAKDSLKAMVRIAYDPKQINKTQRLTIGDISDFSIRTLMMVRNVTFNYRNTYSMKLPGFMPSATFLGQNNSGLLAPGLDFAFGLTNDSYLYKAQHNGWLIDNDSVAHSAISANMESLQIRVALEPFKDLKIDLNANWERTNNNTIQYTFSGMPRSNTGSFNMSIITIGSAIGGGGSKSGYHSEHFDKFVKNITLLQSHIESMYSDAIYPQGSTLAGERYNPSNGGVNLYSAEVMIPSFLSAYTGRDLLSRSTSIFPSMLSMLPNWSITYSGLSRLPLFQRYFKNFNLKHNYKSLYSVGSYNSFLSYVEYMDGVGFVNDITTNNPIPSGMYNIGTVSINESFSPLIGADMGFTNNLTTRLEYRKTRVLSLSMSAAQLVETRSDDITAGASYRITNIQILGAQQGSGRNRVNNNLNMNIDFSYRNQNALCRSIRNLTTQATSGNRAVKMSFSADYIYSKMLTLNLYYDFQSNFPLVSTSSYPTSTHDCGFTLKFSLTR